MHREAFHSFLKRLKLGEYQSGQLGQTVNLLSYDFIGSNPISPTKCGGIWGIRWGGKNLRPHVVLMLLRCRVLW